MRKHRYTGKVKEMEWERKDKMNRKVKGMGKEKGRNRNGKNI